ncbi:hypothetical protein BH11BAC6_BH11BAC6_16580 [soil metagenome]
MKFRLLLLSFLLLNTALHAQDITGIWRGYFNSGYGYLKQQYKYEVQINELTNKATQKGIQGVTYSYRTTVFYGKATLQGIYDSKDKSITIKETKLVELKVSSQTQPCLMTCYLDYRKDGKTEILEGTFTSINVDTKTDCGSGYVYLEKVLESDFVKEDFLLKKKTPVAKPPVINQNPVTKITPKKLPPTNENKSALTAPPVVKKTTPPIKKVLPKPNNNTGNNITKKQPDKTQDTIAKSNQMAPAVPDLSDKIINKAIPIPDAIKARDNPLIKKIFTNSADIQIQLYDNGEIDGDTITVYDNNKVIAYRKGLTKTPITINLKATIDDPKHEIVMVANNLGLIPPNTALMVVTTGGKRYEIFLSSDEKKNAKVIIELNMDSTQSK